MGKIRMRSASISDNPELQAPTFNFSQYVVDGHTAYYNNEERIDFVTDGNSLYVCLAHDGVLPTHENIAEQEGFLKLVSQGPQGTRGPRGEDGDSAVAPRIDVNFEDDQLRVKVNGETKTISPSLTGPTWKPVLENNILTWELTNDRYMPESIDLMDLRPIQERPLLLRTNSDNTKRSDESSGPANFIQWKYEGDEYWTNLISISELMNLTLAGVSIWQNTEGKWHFGHREVVRANYVSDKNGRKIISNVTLGDVLFDAGELPFEENSTVRPDYGVDIDLIYTRLAEIEGSMVKSINGVGPGPDGDVKINIPNPDLTNYATKAWTTDNFQPKGNYLTQHQSLDGLVRNVKVNGTTYSPVDGLVDLGTISVGEVSLFDIRFDSSTHKLQKTSDGQTWTDLVDLDDFGGTVSGVTEADVKHIIGQILEGVLDSAIENEYVKGNDHNYFIRLSDLANYTTTDDVAGMIRDAMTGQNVDYYRVFTLYQRTNSPTVAPIKPVVGVWEWNTAANIDNIALKANASSAWSNHPENATTSTPYLWMTSATYSYLTKSEVGQDPWETPICLTAEPGEDGADGDSVEFIYILCTDAEFNNIKNTTPIAEHGDNRPDDLPVYTTPSGNGWTDRPSGISETYQIEAVSIRTKDNGTWSAYSNPTIWSMWGEDGIDGDGVEYIFLATSDPIIAAQYPPTKLREVYNNANNQDVSAEANDNNIDYAHPKSGFEYYDTREFIPNGWTDNPSDVDEQQPYEYVSLRRYNGTTGHWSAFTTPKKWRMYKVEVQAAESHYYYQPYTEFAFTRTSKDLTGYTVSGGQSYANPLDGIVTRNANNQVDNTITWTDGVPSNSDDQIWVITALIGDESQQQTNVWTGPWKLGDRAGVQVEYSNDTKAATVYSNPSLWNSHNLTLNDFSGTDEQRETLWEAAVRSSYGIWSDYIVDPIYMAMCTFENGSWSDWTIAKVKGEKGNTGNTGPQGPNGSDGADGKDIEFVYFRTDDEHHAPGMSQVYGTYDGLTKVSEDLYADDFLPMVTASGFSPSDEELKIGNDYFWHDHPAGVTLQLPCEWVGVRHSSYQNGQKVWGNFNIALWAKYGEKGRDGDGVEYVFWDLTEEQAGAVSGSVYPTRLADTNYTDNHSPAKHINESECLPSITLTVNGTATTLIAKDDNPGVSDQKPYVYASMRKWQYDANAGEHKWGEFSAIKLWLIKEIPDYIVTTLDIEDDHKQIIVDSNDVITASEQNFYYATGRLSLYENLNLLSNGTVWVNDVKLAQLKENVGASTNVMEVTNNTVSVTNTINGQNVTATVSASYVTKIENSLTCSISLRVSFPANTVLNEPFIIPLTVKDHSGEYSGTANLVITPARVKGIELRSVPNVIKMTTSESYDDLPSTLSFWGTPVFDTMENVMHTNFWFAFDDDTHPEKFCLSNAQLQDAAAADDGSGAKTLYYYFDDNGAINTSGTASEPASYLFKIKLNNVDYNDNSNPWRRWTATAHVNLEEILNTAFPSDYFYFGIGIDDVITDSAIVPIVYSGHNGASTEVVAYIETTSDTIIMPDEEASGSGSGSGSGPRKAPTRGGGNNQTGSPEIEIDSNGQVHIINNGDGTTTLSDDSGNYSVLDFENETIHKFQILKITEYDANNNPTVRYESKEVQEVQNIPSWYLIKDAFYYDAGEDALGNIKPQNKKIYALIVDEGQLVVLQVADNNGSGSGSGSGSGAGSL